MISPVQAARSQLERVALNAICVLACLSTMLIAITPQWPLLLIESAIVIAFIVGLAHLKQFSLTATPAITATCIFLVPFLGAAQVIWSVTVYRYTTLFTMVQWFTLAVVFFLFSRWFAKAVALRDWTLSILSMFASCVAITTILGGIFPSGRIFGLIPTGYDRLYGPFQYYNNAASFFELVLPIPLYGAILERNNLKALGAGLLLSAVLVTGSRTGAILVTLEILVVCALALLRMNQGWLALRPMRVTALVTITISFSAGFLLQERFEQQNPLLERMELNRSSLTMASEHLFIGFGLGTYPIVYPAYATFDTGRFVNHAHNDWAEWTIEGGVPLLFVMLGAAFTNFGRAVRSGWGMGLVAILIHALVDYPFQRFGVSVWIFIVLAAVSSYSPYDADQYVR